MKYVIFTAQVFKLWTDGTQNSEKIRDYIKQARRQVQVVPDEDLLEAIEEAEEYLEALDQLKKI